MQLTQNLWIAAITGLVVLGVAIVMTYHYTKVAYHSVGFNDGAIDSKTRMLQRFVEVTGTIPICTNEQLHKGKEIVSVKEEAIYAIEKNPDST